MASPADLINRMAAARNLTITDNAQGQVVAGLATPGAASSATLVEGKNILRATFKINDPSSQTWFKLQDASQTVGTDENYPSRAYAATAACAGARANLFGLFVSEHPDNAQALVAGVKHQVFRSLWNDIEIEITVQGWLRPDGKLWAPAPDGGATVSVYSPSIFPNATGMAILAIQAVRFGQDSENGTTTTLTLRCSEWLTQAATGGTAAMPTVSADSPDWCDRRPSFHLHRLAKILPK